MKLISNYQGLASATTRPEPELRADLQRAMIIVAADPNSDDGVRAGKVRDWIAQALRMRTPGLNGPLA
ncbi:MAG TPA: hypothetical protein VGO13_00180 [Solirubrobacterales bacterium]|jgi:hypothetical protein|nr:hypothetical protein [Solirubrobacterales bacterium]